MTEQQNTCPACGSYVDRRLRTDAFKVSRPYDMCENPECALTGWDMAISKRQWDEAEARKRAREAVAA